MVGWAPEWCPLATLCGSMDQFMNYTALAGSLAKGAVKMKTNKNVLFKEYLEGDLVVITKDMLEGVDKDIAKNTLRLYSKYYKREERSTKCVKPDGTRCWKSCSQCKEQPNDVLDGIVLSLQEFEPEYGYIPESTTYIAPENYIVRKELRQTLSIAIGALDEDDQTIIELFQEGRTEQEIGDIIGIPQTTVHYRKVRSFKKIRKILEKY